MHIVCSDGAGGICTALSFFDLYRQATRSQLHTRFHLICSTSVFDLVQYLISLRNDLKINCELIWHPTNQDDIELCKKLDDGIDEVFCLTPDKFCVSDFRPDLNELGFTWQQVKENRVFEGVFPFRGYNKRIFLGFQSSQDNIYPQLKQLVENLCDTMPDYHFSFIKVDAWSDNKDIQYNLDDIDRSNLTIRRPLDIVSDFKWILENHNIIVCTDNGLSNIAYHANKVRHLVDMRISSPAMFLRWRQTANDLIAGFLPPDEVARIIRLCAVFPELTGIPRSVLAKIPDDKIQQVLIYKNISVDIIEKYQTLWKQN